MATTPLGIEARRSSARALVASSAASSRSAGSIESARPSSVPANCSRIASSSRSASSPNADGSRTARTARASRGSALRLTPPSSRASRSGVPRESTRPSALIALTRPFAMSPPEWPPRAPDTATSSIVQPAGTGSGGSSSRVNTCVLPAHPIVIAVSLVPSRLRSRRPDTRPGSSAFAPSRPCSSDTVKSSSSGPCTTSGSSAAAIAAATPMPLSAPSVVSGAITQPPSTTTRMRPARGSYALSGSRSQTMSRCAWRTTVGAASRPAEAGTRTTRLPSASTAVSKPRPLAQTATCSRAAASSFGGRAILVSSENRSHTPAGSSPASTSTALTTGGASAPHRRRGGRSRERAAS